MRREFCDRCGVEGGSKEERARRDVPKVVRVTFVPLARVADLCGPCRRALDAALDEFLGGSSSGRTPGFGPGDEGSIPSSPVAAPGAAE